MAYASNNNKLIDWFETQLTETFKVKLLGSLKMFIGWEFT